MADDNEDQWLYGDSNDGKDNFSKEESLENNKESTSNLNQDELKNIEEGNAENNPEESTEQLEASAPEEHTSQEPNEDEEQEVDENGTKEPSQEDPDAPSDSDSDDDVHVVIGDIKSAPAYNNINIKRSGLLTNASGIPDKLNKQPGKFSIDEFETIGVINGIQAHEFNLDQLEDKPWRQPGADITDYFNYGFNEETWRAYCERQKRMRSESGVGLVLNAGSGGPNLINTRVSQVAITNDNSKYSGIAGPKRAGPPPGRKMAGSIDVIGSSGLASRRNLDKSPPKENVIQVMTADRREYSRKPGFPDMSVPPPGPGMVPPPFDLPPPPAPYQEPPPFYMPEPDPYFQSYEPTQDSQWGNDPTWQPTNLTIPLTASDESKDIGPKSIPTMVPPLVIPPLIASGPPGRDPTARGDNSRGEGEVDSMGRERDRERERDRDRERSERDKDSSVRERERDSVTRDEDKERDRSRSQYRHKERHRHRSRSRSRRHKSRSRSPSRRKKKSRRTDRERSKEESE
ncbi:Similar to Fip1l1: Pre-mRNA 3'-end-processing factor FIP1 (Rattus norvegicus) [Cotesia congregata]|uniref:Similar to Fip1l1: Pre-mRNA 3'-end-processing factor FIP1 (Rattus norvegicus) n=1 Tax=Cotesia congregata TaxID=51543 RepID=A0A8J2HT77_COTCN|nr:Similar to Fip1l1: Pre-mRNA 3'-end-processing factor FIP1 (Rattus norvegicus) [Cotesia congregata]